MVLRALPEARLSNTWLQPGADGFSANEPFNAFMEMKSCSSSTKPLKRLGRIVLEAAVQKPVTMIPEMRI